jgi:amino acid transporter
VTAVWRFLTGPPLRARDVSGEQITPLEGLPALSLDALTSVAYGPQAIIAVLAVAGAGALHLILPVTIAIVALLAILVFSYRQVIDAYPGGGGAYAVSRANLGSRAGLVAAAALVVDYTLTVAVSIAAGVASLTSAFPGLRPATVPICLGILAVVTVFNLRGLGDAARAFLLPTMAFIIGLGAVVVVGLIHPLALHAAQPGRSLLPAHAVQAASVLLVLKAFAAGCSALTGVEAIANGVPLFKRPRQARAKRTELLLGVILGAMLLGVAVLADRWHIGPRTGQTALSQIIAAAVGRDWAYVAMSLTITVVLALAANTSFAGLPVLASLLARDHFLPHLFSLRDDRQVFACGVLTLAVLSGALLVAVGGSTQTLIPLFAIGVFTGFTLSQFRAGGGWAKNPPATLAPPGGNQRHRRRGHGRGHGDIPVHQVHRGRLGGGVRRARFHCPVHGHSPLLRPGRAGPRPGQPPSQARGQARDSRRTGGKSVPAFPACALRGAVDQRAGHRRHRGDQRRWPGHQRRARLAGGVGPLEPGAAAAGAAHRIRLGGRADRGVHRPAPRAAHRTDRGAGPGNGARPAAVPPPAQSPRPRPDRRTAAPP